MGLRPLDLAQWLEVDEHREEELALKDQLLADSYNMVVATNPEGEQGSLELLEEIRSNLATFHPALANVPNGVEHPIVAASRLVQEDLCVLVREDDVAAARRLCVFSLALGSRHQDRHHT